MIPRIGRVAEAVDRGFPTAGRASKAGIPVAASAS
jgi:hypothetical protein